MPEEIICPNCNRIAGYKEYRGPKIDKIVVQIGNRIFPPINVNEVEVRARCPYCYHVLEL